MGDRPILFSAPMVRAILEDRKRMTRRVVKSFKHLVPALGVEMDCIKDVDGWPSRLDIAPRNWECCPYGQPGDRLWVRETLACTYHHGLWYAADRDGFNNMIQDERANDLCERYGHPYFDTEERHIPSIFMPRWASRILLEITSVRVERVQDISEADALAEGCGFVRPYNQAWSDMDMPREDFRELWDSINAKRGFGWDANPWVWVIEFKRVEGK